MKRNSKVIAKVKEIQVYGGNIHKSLLMACKEFAVNEWPELPQKICFVIELPNGETKQITIREEDREKDSIVVAYGSFEGLPSFLDYAKGLHKK